MKKLLLILITAGVAALLKNQSTIKKHITMTNEELLAKLTAANTKADKIITEVQTLKDTVTGTPGVPQNIVDAVNTLEAKLQSVDELNEDAATPPEQPAQ